MPDTNHKWRVTTRSLAAANGGAEVRELVQKGVVGPLDGFISAKTRASFAATLKLVKDEKTTKWKAEYDFGDKVDLGAVESFWADPATGVELCEVGSSYVLRERENGEWKQVFRVPRLCEKGGLPSKRQLVERARRFDQGFISRKSTIRGLLCATMRRSLGISRGPVKPERTASRERKVGRKSISRRPKYRRKQVHGGELSSCTPLLRPQARQENGKLKLTKNW